MMKQAAAVAGTGTGQAADVPLGEAFSELIKQGGYDHIDFGCSKGASLEYAKKLSGRRGLGIDIAPDKVKATQAAGFDAMLYDINKIPDETMVRFTIMSHFLEHVPNPADVRSFVRKACRISKEFVYIQQPYFDADGYLCRHGLKLYWSDWRGHPNPMSSLELWLLLRTIRTEGTQMEFSVHARGPILDSKHPCIHPLDSPVDQHQYAADLHPAKQELTFQDKVFREIVCLVTFPGTDHARMLKMLRFDETLVSHQSAS